VEGTCAHSTLVDQALGGGDFHQRMMAYIAKVMGGGRSLCQGGVLSVGVCGEASG
jgi:hypothetical protein